MNNLSMEKKIKDRDAIDISGSKMENGYYILEHFNEHAEVDYCDAIKERWIWSIGKRHSDGVILASTGTDFYENPAFHCLWLR